MSTNEKITFVDAVAAGFRHATDFRGRTDRRAFWYWFLFLVLVQLVTSTADAFLYPQDMALDFNTTDLTVLASNFETQLQHSLWSFSFASTLLFFLPDIAITVRRFRDAGWKPWLAVASLAGFYGGLAMSLAFSTTVLSQLTSAGAAVTDAALAGAVTNIILAFVFVCVQFGAMIVLIVGGCQPTRPRTPTE